MNVLVTGGCGFIGSYVVAALQERGAFVTVLDNRAVPEEKGHVRFINADVREYEKMHSCFESVDIVFHLAGISGIEASQNQPDLFKSVNVDGTFNVLKASQAAGVKKIIYANTSSIYENQSGLAVDEAGSIKLRHPYAETKYAAEEMILKWANDHGKNAVSLRLFKVYGKSLVSGAFKNAIIRDLLNAGQNKKPFSISACGNDAKDYIHVKDVAHAFIKAAECNVGNEVFNIGSGQTHSIKDLAAILNVSIDDEGDSLCVGAHAAADIGKANAFLGWTPSIDLQEGLSNPL